MAVTMVPVGRRSFVKIADDLDNPNATPDIPFYLLGAQVIMPRNLIVPPVLSRDYQFAYTEGVRTAQIQMQILCFKENSAQFGGGMETFLMQWFFERSTANGDSHATNLLIHDGIQYRLFRNCKVQAVSMSIQKGGLLAWNLQVFAPDIGQSATNTQFPVLPTQIIPLTWRDVVFYAHPSNSTPYPFPIYAIEFSLVNNLMMNAPVADGDDNIGWFINRWDAGHQQASCQITYAAYNIATSHIAKNEHPLRIEIAASDSGTRKFIFPRLVPENPEDLRAVFQQNFHTVRFVALGQPASGGYGDPPLVYA